MIQHLRRLGRPASFRVSGSAVLLAYVGVAMTLGVVGLSAASAPTFAEPASYPTGVHPESVAIGDLNGDGKPELASANREGRTVSVLANTGGGRFLAKLDYAAGFEPASVAIGDLNGDGKADLAAAVSCCTNTVAVFLNRGDGSFQPKLDYGTGTGPRSVAIGDLNGDAKPDLATANYSDTVSVLLNRGDGSFQAKLDYGTGGSPVAVAIGDLNGDAKPDLATANYLPQGAVSVLLNRGDGSFQAKLDYGTGSSPFSVVIGDLNGDAKPDLATANYLPESTVSVLLNRGDGSFQPKVDYGTGPYSRSVAIGDLNGDGKPDLATASYFASVSVLANRGGGRFSAKLDYETGSGAVSVAIGDLNGDHKPDLATANEQDNTVSVLANNTIIFCEVPRVKRKKLADAKRVIASGLCRVGKIRRAYSKSVKRGRVISQKPKPGMVLAKGGKVNLVVSRGRKPARLFGITYFPGARVHTALLRNSILNPEGGAVEAWYRQESDPVPFKHNPHRIFGGPYSLTGIDEVNLFSQDSLDSGDPRLHFTLFFGDEPPPFTPAHVVAVRSLVDGVEGYPISDLNGRWIHIAGVWDRLGIGGSSDTVRLYVDGDLVAASQASDWGITPCASRRPAGQWRCLTDVAGCNDTCEDTFAVDNLKLWNYAKTDYSDRFEEGSSAVPGLLLWNKLGSADEVSHSAYGPNLVSFNCIDPETPHFGQRCTIDVPGTLAYPRGVFGGAAGITNNLARCRAPKLRRRALPDARRAIARANCRLGKIRRAYSRRVKRGRVISQRPKAGTVLRNGGKVNLVVSRGRRH